MTDEIVQVDASPEPKGTPEAASPEPKGTGQLDPIEQARRRQAGAEAARQTAERQRDEAHAELERLRALVPKGDPQPADSEVSRLTALAAAAEKRAQEAETKALAKVLDAQFPHARKELPEVTDEVRLAKFEAMLRPDDEPSGPTPRGNNPPRTGSEPAKKPTIEQVEAALAGMTPPWQVPQQ